MKHRRTLALFAFTLGCTPLTALVACGSEDDTILLAAPGSPIEVATGVRWFVDADPATRLPRTAIPAKRPAAIVEANERYEVAAKAFLAANVDTFGVQVDKIAHVETLRGQDGIWRVKFVQKAGELTLQNADLTVSIDAGGALESFHGPYYPTFEAVAAQKPTLTPAAAGTAATAAAQKSHPGSVAQTAALLVIIDPIAKLPVLAYRVRMNGAAGFVHVDATTGRIVGMRALQQPLAQASGTGIKNNVMKFDVADAAAGTFSLKRPAEGGGVPIEILARTGGSEEAPTGAALTTANPNEWEAGRNANEKGSAVEVYTRLVAAAGFYSNLGWKSFDNKGSPIKAFVYSAADGGINASFSGDKNNPFLLWTAGDGQNASPVGTDVIAHEYMHGIVAFTSDLAYESESGAINEALADIFGNAAEQATTDGDKDLLGEYTGALRSMKNPTSKGQPDQYADRQQLGGQPPSEENDFGGVHTNSGIVNHAYWLMANGGTHAKSNVQVPSMGDADALKVWWETARERLKSNSTMRELAAETLKTASSMQVDTKPVGCAWVAVGVLTTADLATFSVTCTGADEDDEESGSSSSSGGEDEESSSSSSGGDDDEESSSSSSSGGDDEESSSSSSTSGESTSGASGGESTSGASSGKSTSGTSGTSGTKSDGGTCATADGCGGKKAGWYCSEIKDKVAYQCGGKGDAGVSRIGAAFCVDGGASDEGSKKACGCSKPKDTSCKSSSTCSRDSSCGTGSACGGGTCGKKDEVLKDSEQKQKEPGPYKDTGTPLPGGDVQTASDSLQVE